MLEFFAAILNVIANFGADSASAVFSYEPEMPESLIDND